MGNVVAFQKIQLVAKYVPTEEIHANYVILDFIITMENVNVYQQQELTARNVLQIQISVQHVKQDLS